MYGKYLEFAAVYNLFILILYAAWNDKSMQLIRILFGIQIHYSVCLSV